MVSELAPSTVDREFESRSGQTKDKAICICCISANHAALRKKRNIWWDRNGTKCLPADCCCSELALHKSS
jgi:hypothetical protein